MYKICKLLLVLVTLAAFATCAPREPDPHFEEKCQAKFNISDEELTDFSKVFSDDTVTVERKFKCYTKCLLDEVVERDENGKIDVKSYTDRDPGRNPSEPTIRIANECKEKIELEEDECEYEFKFMACVRKNPNQHEGQD